MAKDSNLRKTSDEKHNIPPYTAHVVSTKCWLEMETSTMFLAKISTLPLILELDSCGSRKFVELVYRNQFSIHWTAAMFMLALVSMTSSGNMWTNLSYSQELTLMSPWLLTVDKNMVLISLLHTCSMVTYG